MPAAEPTLRDRLGGRWALSWQASVLGSVLISLLIVVRGSTLVPPDEQVRAGVQWFGVALVAVLVKSAWQFLADRTFLRSRRERLLPLWGVITFDMSVGVIFGGATIAAEIVINPVGQDLSVLGGVVRVSAFAITTVCWYVITTILFDARQRFWDERARLLDELVLAQLSQVQESQVMEALREQVREELHEPITNAQVATAAALLEDDVEPSELSEQLRGLASGSVRSLSHALLDEEKQAYPRSSFLVVMGSFSREIRFSVVPMLVLIATLYLLDVTIRRSPQVSVLSTLVFAALCSVVMLAANRVMDRVGGGRIVIYGMTVIILEGIALAYISGFTVFSFADGGQDLVLPSGREVAAMVLFVALGLIGSSYAAAVITHRTKVLDRLRADADAAVAEQLARAQRVSDASRAVASDLHGALQTRLMICAGALDQASADGDAEAMRMALDQAWRVLRTPFSEAEQTSSVRGIIDHHVDQWQGLLRITCTVDRSIDAVNDEVAQGIGVVLEEGLANAFRHGGASSAEIVIRADGPGADVRISDDGSGPMDPTSGMGSRRMAAVGDVSLVAGVPGAVLTVRVRADSST